MGQSINVFDVVALTEDLPEFGLRRGQVGTVVEYLAPTYLRLSSTTMTGALMHPWVSASTS